MKLDFKVFLKLILSLGLGIGLVWYMQTKLTFSDKELIWYSFQNVNSIWVGITIILAIFACILRGLRWGQLLAPLNYRPKKSVLISTIFIMYLANLLFPRLGEVLRCSLLYDQEDIPLETSIGTMITERFVDVIGMGLIALLGILLEHDKFWEIYHLSTDEKGNGSHYILLILLVLLIIGGFFIWKNNKLRAFFLSKLSGLFSGLKSILKLEQPLLFITYSIGIYGIYFLNTILMYKAVIGTEGLSVTSGLVTLTAGTIAMGITPGGVGAFQLLTTKALELYQIPKAVGLAYSWINWSIQTGVLVISGIFSWLFLNFRKNK